MILTQVVIPYVSKKFIRRLEQSLQCSTLDSQSKIKNTILVFMPLLKQFINGRCLIFSCMLLLHTDL